MKKKQRLAIDDALNSALKPPPARRPSDNLTSLLSQYAPPPQTSEIASQRSISSQSIPQENIPLEGIPQQGTPGRFGSSQRKERQASPPLIETSAERGYYPTFNDLDDRVIPGLKLDTFEQSVLRRLYRLSRGFKSQECEAGLGALSKACNISRSQVQKTINSLLSRGLIHSLGHSQSGTKYRVLEQFPDVPSKGIPHQGIPQESGGVPQESSHGIPQGGNNKKNKDILNTHTNTEGVGVGSRFTPEECRRYAEHLRSTGQGINNPGGYATTIHRTGEADALIESFLNPAPAQSLIDASQCLDCQGMGFYYPKGIEHGVTKCQHARLKMSEESDESAT
jgi:hypothetical protein